MDDVRRRKTSNPAISAENIEFLEWCVNRIQKDGRTPSVTALKDYMGMFGPAAYGGFSEFIMDCYYHCGAAVDLEHFLEQRGFAPYPSEAKREEDEEETSKQAEFKIPAMDI
jgi:hypothetical protein